MSSPTYPVLRRMWTCFGLLLAVQAVQADDGWGRLKLGMSGSEVVAAVGRPLLCSQGRGLQRWTYDDGAEVLLHGRLIGWTAPGVAGVEERSADVWQVGKAGLEVPVVAFQAAPTSRPASAAAGGSRERLAGKSFVRHAALPSRVAAEAGRR